MFEINLKTDKTNILASAIKQLKNKSDFQLSQYLTKRSNSITVFFNLSYFISILPLTTSPLSHAELDDAFRTIFFI